MKSTFYLWILVLAPFWMSLQAQDHAGAVAPKVEVYYFHATMRCATCNAVEEQTRKTLDEGFANELKAGTIQLKVLNLEQKENKDLVRKFDIGWSSLVLYMPGSDKTVNLTEMAFANARAHPEDFRAELEKKLKELL